MLRMLYFTINSDLPLIFHAEVEACDCEEKMVTIDWLIDWLN